MILSRGNKMTYFDYATIKAIKAYCHQINHSKADVFIMMARKSACFFQLLMDSGYIDKKIISKKQVVTDRCIGASCEFMQGKKIALIDDIMISGSSIAKAIHKLNEKNIRFEDIEIIVIATDESKCTMNFLNNGYDLLNRKSCITISSAECIQLSSNISKTLTAYGVPYDIDFPAYYNIVLHENEFKELITQSGWDVFDVTNIYNKKYDISSLTLIPRDNVKQKLWLLLGVDLNQVAHIKVRMYIYENKDQTVTINVVPMVIFNEVSKDELETIYNILDNVYGQNKVLEHYCIEAIYKLYCIQFMIAIKLISILFENDYNHITNTNIFNLPYIFGYDKIDKITNFFAEYYENQKSIETIVFIKNELKPDMLEFNIEEAQPIKCNYDINQKLLSPFEYWYTSHEIPARNILNTEGLSFLNIETIRSQDRLEKGFSFNALCELLCDIKYKYNTEYIVSIFIDRAIDLGLIVPITYMNNNVFCRAYRHGEDFAYGDTDRKNILYFLTEFYSQIRYTITDIQFEKLIVLFMQLGLNKGIFNEFMGFDNSQLLSIEFCIHGAVPVVIEEDVQLDDLHIYVQQNDYCKWLSDRLYKEDYIIRPLYTNNKFTINKDKTLDFSDIPREYLCEIKDMALLFSYWFNLMCKSNKKSKFTEQITILTSCHSDITTASALLAELHISVLDWDNTIIKYLNKNKCEYFSSKLAHDHAYLAMNNGRKKVQWYESNAAIKVIDDISQNIGKKDIYRSNAWDKLWVSFLTIKYGECNSINSYLLTLKTDIYIYNVLYRTLRYIFSTNEVLKKRLKKEIEKLISEGDILLQVSSLLTLLNNTGSLNFKLKKLKEFGDTFTRKTNTEIINIERELTNSNKYIIKYNGAMIISLSMSYEKKYINDIRKIIDYENEHTKNQTFFLPMQCNKNSTYLTVFIKGKPEQNKHFLMTCIDGMKKNFNDKDINFKLILIPFLSDELNFERNIQKSPISQWNIFHRDIISPMKEYFKIKESNTYECLYLMNKDFINNIRLSREDDIILSNEMDCTYKQSNVDIPMSNQKYSATLFSPKILTIGIISVIDEEIVAVKKQFNMEKTNDFEATTSRTIYKNIFTVKGINVRLFLIQSLNQGNQAALDAYHALSNLIKMDYCVLLGVAGSLDEEKLKIEDVIIADNIVDGQLGKETSEGYRYENKMPEISANVKNKINEFKIKIFEEQPIDNNGKKFKIVVGGIFDNNRLIGTKKSEHIKNVKEIVNRKTYAVEMESAGVAYGVYSSFLDGNAPSNGLLIIRGISDYADEDKPHDNKFHLPAAKNAAYTLAKMLDTLI